MRTIKILSFILYPLVICFLFMIPFIGYLVFDLWTDLENRVPTYMFLGKHYQTSDFALPIYISTIAYFFSYIAVILCMYLFYKVIEEFRRKRQFDFQVIKYFKKMGILLCLSFILKFIIKATYSYTDRLFEKDLTSGLNDIFEFPVTTLIFGLFFLILSEIFEFAKNQKEENTVLKEENELTI